MRLLTSRQRVSIRFITTPWNEASAATFCYLLILSAEGCMQQNTCHQGEGADRNVQIWNSSAAYHMELNGPR